MSGMSGALISRGGSEDTGIDGRKTVSSKE